MPRRSPRQLRPLPTREKASKTLADVAVVMERLAHCLDSSWASRSSSARSNSSQSSKNRRGGVGYGCQGSERWCRRCKSNCGKGDSRRRAISLSVRVHDVLHVLVRDRLPGSSDRQVRPGKQRYRARICRRCTGRERHGRSNEGSSVGITCQSTSLAVQIEQG